MEIMADQKQISDDEKLQIDRQVKADLIDHLYEGCLPGTVSGIVVSFALFLDYYGHTPTPLLIGWIAAFNFMMIALTFLYFLYLNHKPILALDKWEAAYSSMMVGCAMVWVPSIYLIPADMTRQYLALIALFLATTGYATGTIGQFKLCIMTLLIMLVPLVIWCLYKGGIFYNIIAVYSIIYMAFMFGINHRSTKWFKDSLKLKLENTLVSYQANHDVLTGLPNQRLLPQFIEAAIQLIQGTSNYFALVCFSLNRMEIIHDSLGHQVSDFVMKAVTERLKLIAAKADKMKESAKYILTISRKDTFNVIILPLKSADINDEIKIIFSVLDEPFYLEKQGVKMTASMGISMYPRDGSNAASLIMNADAAMLLAKQFGGNRLEVYRAEINAQLPKQLEIESDLHNAIKNNELHVYYQPFVDLKTKKITGSEALLRWIHPVHGFISPANFIPLAEETGVIVPIGAWVLLEACKQTLIWHQSGFPHLTISVNVSEKQLRQEGLIETVKHVLNVTGFDPQYLELELTETAILDESVTRVIKEFKNMGLSLAVDDFGTGYSGLSYLKRFSIDKLKIDQSFIRDIPTNNDSMTIVSAILAMTKELDITSLAEGVETEVQLKFLIEKGCDFVQGYYFSKPLEVSSFTQLLLQHNKTIEDQERIGIDN